MENSSPSSIASFETEESELSSAAGSDQSKVKKRIRKNTLEEKRKMRRERKQRRRSEKRVSSSKHLLKHEQMLRSKAEVEVIKYKRMSRSYWERWHWELQQRKDCVRKERLSLLSSARGTRGHTACSSSSVRSLQEIDPAQLHHPPDRKSETETYIGRGSFGVVRVQLFRGIKVAVKEVLPRTVLDDMLHEASIIARLSHPYVPYLFGICSQSRPYRIIMQFHSLAESTRSHTFFEALRVKLIIEHDIWIALYAQLVEGIRYLHDDAGILHNDLKCDNILICDSVADRPTTSEDTNIQSMIIDFGKATTVRQGRKYSLSEVEKAEYTRRYPHMAPEVIEGITHQTRMSDIYSVGGILFAILDHGNCTEHSSALTSLATRCRSPTYISRPTAKDILSFIQKHSYD